MSDDQSPARRHPPWLKVRAPGGAGYVETRATVKALGLHTVCEEAHCPNIGECWGTPHRDVHAARRHLHAELRLLRRAPRAAARRSTRTSRARVAEAVARLGLRHVVVTSVNRDDLPDGGAAHFAATARAIKALRARLRGSRCWSPTSRATSAAVAHGGRSRPIDILNHNIETVPRLYKRVRPGAQLRAVARRRSRQARASRADCLTKAGLMLGLGETSGRDRSRYSATCVHVGCDILTLGQYLRPSRGPPARSSATCRRTSSRQLRERGARRWASATSSPGPLVRSSYHAWAHVP